MKMAWYFVQTLMGCIGSVGFAVLFNTVSYTHLTLPTTPYV